MIPVQENKLISYLSDQSGVPNDQIYCILVVLSSIPLSLFNYCLTKPTTRLIYSFVCGVVLQFLVYEHSNIIFT